MCHMRLFRSLVLFGLVIGFSAGVVAGGDPQELSISPSENPVLAGKLVIFTFSPKIIQEDDAIMFSFGDGHQKEVLFDVSCAIFGGCNTIEHTYAGPGVFTVSAEGTANGVEVAGTTEITVTTSGVEHELFIATAGRTAGYQGSQWRTDVVVHNPGNTTATFEVHLLVRNQNNAAAPITSLFMLSPSRSVRYVDIIGDVFQHTGAAALRFIPVEGSLAIVSRTYNQTQDGTFGQFVPSQLRSHSLGFGETGLLLGASHNPNLSSGFRTNLGLVNTSPGPIRVEVVFHDDLGNFKGQRTWDLEPFEFRQEDRVFEQVTNLPVPSGFLEVRTTTAGGSLLAYLSVVDNITNDPVFVPFIRKP